MTTDHQTFQKNNGTETPNPTKTRVTLETKVMRHSFGRFACRMDSTKDSKLTGDRERFSRREEQKREIKCKTRTYVDKGESERIPKRNKKILL